MPKQTNTKIILILIITSVIFIGVLVLLYFTFGNSNVTSLPTQEVLTSQSSSKMITNKTFDEETESTKSTASSSPISQTLSQSSTSQSLIAISATSKTVTIDLDDTIGKDLKLPETPLLSFDFDAKDDQIISKYIKTDYKSKVISKLKTDKNQEILVLRIPKDNIDELTEIDFPKTFQFSNEDRQSETKDSIFLYYINEKRIAFLGDYISNIQPFNYESQDYWLVHYNTELLISKPNFSNWSVINLEDSEVLDIYKKSDFEFQIIKQSEFGDILENRIEIISPQKYLIEGFFGSKDN
jgi:hypothetical protein